MKTKDTLKQYVIYSRKSKFTGKGESIENQIELCRQYIAMHFGEEAAENVLVYEDEGFSGGNLERPQFKKMMKDSQKIAFAAIVVYRLDDTLLQMNYLPSDSIIRNKDQVVTSGSTVYPRGLIIGSVVDAGYEETGVAKFALLDPAADINSLEQVFIITAYTTEVVTTPGTSAGSETATAPSETAAATQPTTPVG